MHGMAFRGSVYTASWESLNENITKLYWYWQ